MPWTLKALAAGKHVLCEKPIALDAEEARPLIDARNRSGKLVAEAFMVRFHPQWRRARELARDGTIGETRAIQTFFSYRLLDPDNVRNRPPGGGGLYDIGCYAILTARYIFGAEPTRVVATIDWDPKFKTDRLASALLEFPGGRQLTFTVGTQLSAHQRVTIVGDDGRIEVMIPFNAPIDRPTEIAIDTGADLIGGGRRVEKFPICDQYTLQGDAFSTRDRGRGEARVPDRGRDRQHARHRRPVPLRQERSVGEALGAGRAAAGPVSPPNKSKEIQRKTLGFPWIPLAESGLINGLRRIQVKNLSRVTLCLKSNKSRRRRRRPRHLPVRRPWQLPESANRNRPGLRGDLQSRRRQFHRHRRLLPMGKRRRSSAVYVRRRKLPAAESPCAPSGRKRRFSAS